MKFFTSAISAKSRRSVASTTATFSQDRTIARRGNCIGNMHIQGEALKKHFGANPSLRGRESFRAAANENPCHGKELRVGHSHGASGERAYLVSGHTLSSTIAFAEKNAFIVLRFMY